MAISRLRFQVGGFRMLGISASRWRDIVTLVWRKTKRKPSADRWNKFFG
jgi:hypothetical protein